MNSEVWSGFGRSDIKWINMNRIKIISILWILDLHEWTTWTRDPMLRDAAASFLYSMDGTGRIVTAKVVYTSRKGRSGWTDSLMRSMSFARRTVSFISLKVPHSFWNAGTKKSLNSSLAAAGDCLYIPNKKGTRCDHLQRCQEKTKWSDRLLLALPGRWPSSSRRVSSH